MSDPVTGNQGQDPTDPTDPYSTAGMAQQIMQQIDQIIDDLKKHPADMTQAINEVFNKMQQLQGNLVGQSSETQSAMTVATNGIANLQAYGADKDGTPVQDINVYTGLPEVNADGSKKMVSPEKAFQDESTFLLNNPNTQYQLDSSGKAIQAVGADGKPMFDKDGNPVFEKNKLYTFMHTKGNEAVAEQLKSAVEGSITSLSDKNCPATFSGDSGYTIDPKTGQVELDDKGNPKGEQVSITQQGTDSKGNPTLGSIGNMWNKAEPGTDTSGGSTTPKTPDSSILNAFQSAMGTLGQAGTASSSTLQAFIKVLTDNFTGSQGNLNNALNKSISLLTAMVNNSRPGGG
jgi:hypothetical protein